MASTPRRVFPAVASSTSLDLDAVVAVGWLDPADVCRDESAAAQRFWEARCRGDASRMIAAASAADLVRTWTGQTAHDLGSFALGLHLPSSDLDLGISVPGDPEPVHTTLAARARYRGEGTTRSGQRHRRYSLSRMGADVDLSTFTETGLAVELRMLEQIRAGLTRADAVVYLWVKHILHRRRDRVAYDTWTAAPYQRFCHTTQTPPP
jgi:hypothetical protein